MSIRTIEEVALADHLERRTSETLRRLIEAHQNRVYNLCFQILRHVQDSEDAAQRTLLKVAEASLSIRDATSFRSWLYRVAFTTALDLREEQVRRHARHRAYAFARTDSFTPELDPEGYCELHRAVASLEEDLRDLLVQHYFERASLADLATRQNCSRVAVWKKIEKGKSRIRETLASSRGALGAAALDAHLDSIVPVKAPAKFLAKAGMVPAAVPVAASPGGILMATKSLGTSKAVSAALLLAALGLGGGILAGQHRAQREIESLGNRLRVTADDLGGARREIARLSAELAKASPGAEVRPKPSERPPSVNASAAAPPPPAPPGKATEDLRRHFRRLVRATLLAKKAGKEGVTTLDPEMSDPETQQAFAALVPYFISAQNPCRQADKYTELVRVGVEAMLEETGVVLSADQKLGLDNLSERVRTLLDHSKDAPVSQQGIAMLESQRQLVSGIQSLLTPDQLSQWGSALGLSMFSSSSDGSSVSVVSGETAPQTIAKGWAARYGLDPGQEIAAQSAARYFAGAIARLDQEFAPALVGSSGSGEAASTQAALSLSASSYEYRVRALQAQMEALSQLEGLVSPEQRARFQNSALQEYVGPTVQSALSPPAKK